MNHQRSAGGKYLASSTQEAESQEAEYIMLQEFPHSQQARSLVFPCTWVDMVKRVYRRSFLPTLVFSRR